MNFFLRRLFSKKNRRAKTLLLQNLRIRDLIFQKKPFLKIKKLSKLGQVTRAYNIIQSIIFMTLHKGCLLFLEEIKKEDFFSSKKGGRDFISGKYFTIPA